MAHFKQKYPLFLAFTTGMCIMAVELTASRLLAPYFGTSLFVWTNIIAVIMVALAAGYYVGGKISEKRPELNCLLKIILIAAVLTFIIPFITQPLSLFILKDIGALSRASLVILFGSFMATLILFFIPIMLLGIVSPYLIKIISIFHSDVGNVAGSVFAVSTAGSILGTFLPSLVFIPWIGSKQTMIVFSIILIIVASWGMLMKRKYMYLGMLVFMVGPLIASPSLNAHENTLLETESAYQYIQVVESNGVRELVYNEGMGTQSVFMPNSYLTGHMYFDLMAASPALINKDKIQVLNLGLAGGTAVRGMSYLFDGKKQIHIDGVEIDDKIIQIAKNYFDLNIPNLDIYNEDGRIFARFAQKKYDLILVDAYSNQIYIPWHMTTVEFFQDLENILYEDGFVAINLNATSENSKLFRAFTNTLAKTFDYVYSAPVVGTFNYLIIASNKPVELRRLSGDVTIIEQPGMKKMVDYLVENSKLIRYNPDEFVLTDDRAPVEHLTDFMYLQYFVNKL